MLAYIELSFNIYIYIYILLKEESPSQAFRKPTAMLILAKAPHMPPLKGRRHRANIMSFWQ